MDSRTLKTSNENLLAAMRRRWRTGPSSSTMSLKQLDTSEFSSASPVSRSRRLSEVEDLDGSPDYDPNSPEPRYLQLAKAELMRRKDLKCRDCGFMGLPSPDGMCPDCGGIMNAPEEQLNNPEMTTDQIRSAIRQQWMQKSKQTEGRSWFDVTGDTPEDKPKVPSNASYRRPPKETKPSGPSCWGCGHDYLNRWTKHDLNRHWKNKDDGKRMKDPICPDCYGEAGVMEGVNEYAHRTIPTEFETGHMADLISHYGCRADGDKYTVHGDKFSHLLVTGHNWIHHHHGVTHSGHGAASLHSHLQRTFGHA